MTPCLLKNDRSARQPSSRRRGITVLELVATAVLLGTVMASMGPALSWVRRQRDLAKDHQVAALELANIAERLALRPVEELTTDRLADESLSEIAQSTLQQPRLTITAEEEPGPPASHRITLQLTWQDAGGRDVAPRQLVCWRHPPTNP